MAATYVDESVIRKELGDSDDKIDIKKKVKFDYVDVEEDEDNDLMDDEPALLLTPPLRQGGDGSSSSCLLSQDGPNTTQKYKEHLSQFIPKTTKWRKEINGNITDFVVTPLENKIVIMILQLGKIGSWVEARTDERPLVVVSPENPVPATTYNSNILMGDRVKFEYYRAYARQLIEIFHNVDPSVNEILLGIGMKDSSPPTFRACMDSVKERLV